MPDAVDVVLERAEALLGFRRPDEARTVLTAALGSAPDDARLWATLARTEWARHDRASARTAAERALANDPDNASALSTRIDTLLAARDVVGAKRAADELLERRPQWAHAHLLWAYSHTRWSRARRNATEEQVWPTSDVPRAAAALDRALELAPHDARLFADVARCFRALSWSDPTYQPRVGACLDRALELEPNDEWVMLAAGDVGGIGRRAEAAARVLAQHPTSWEALRRIDRAVLDLVSVPGSVVGWFLIATVLGLHDAAGGGAPVLARILGWVLTAVTALWMLGAELISFRRFPRDVLRQALRRNPVVGPALVVTWASWVGGTVGAVLVLGGALPADGPGARWVLAGTAVALLLQFLGRDATHLQLQRTAIGSGLWDGAVAADGRRRVRESTRGSVLLSGSAALLAWWFVATSAPSAGSWAAAAVPLLLAMRSFDTAVVAELLRVPVRRPRLVVFAVLAVTAGLVALAMVVLQVARAVVSG